MQVILPCDCLFNAYLSGWVRERPLREPETLSRGCFTKFRTKFLDVKKIMGTYEFLNPGGIFCSIVSTFHEFKHQPKTKVNI